MQFRLAFLSFLAALIFPFAAHSQAVPDEVKELQGSWEISDADREKICKMTLATDKAPRGYKLSFEAACAEAFEVTKDIVAWRLDKDGLHLVDAQGQTLIDLDEVEKGIFEGMRPGEGRYFVQSLAAIRPEAKPEQVFGEWQVSKGGDEPICTIVFSNKRVRDNFSLQLKSGCGSAVTGFAPASWKMESGELVITGKGTWRFEEAGDIAWRRIPEGNDPLWLVKPTEMMPANVTPESGG